MKRQLILLLLLLGLSTIASARDSARGWCEEGNRSVVTSGLNSTTKVQASHPSCTITIYVHGGGLAVIFSDNNNTPLANPFTSQSDGQWQFYADNGRYDATMASAGFSQTITYSDILLCDPFAVGSTCNNGGTIQAHNLLSTTHLDTIPASPPVRGDLVTAQNQTSPTGVNPSWARLPLGTNGQVLLSNGIDALWGNLTAGTGITITNNTGSLTISSSGGTGCTLPGIDTVVLFEHPMGTCDGTTHFTWDVVNSNLQVSDASANTVGTSDTFIVGPGNTAASSTFVYVLGDQNFASSAGTGAHAVAIGSQNVIQAILASGSNLANVSIGSNQIGAAAHANSGGYNNISVGVNGITFNANTTVNLGSNFIGRNSAGTSATTNSGVVVGGNYLANCINAVGCSSAGTGTITGFGVFGDSNNLNKGAGSTGTIAQAYIGGFSNRINTTLGNVSGGSTIWGFDNEIDSAVGNDVQIFGASNTSHTSGTSTCLGASDAAIGGALNVVTGSGNFMIFGGGNVVTSLNCVAIFGDNITATAANTAYYGMSPTAGLVITASNGLGTGFDNVQRSPLTFTHLPACAGGTEGSFASITDSTTSVPGATITGGGANHVLGYCNGTNWIVTGASTSSFPDVKIIPAANCPNATAGGGWSYATSTWTAACRAGTNNLGGALQLAPSGGGAAQFRIELPLDWNTASQPFIRIEYASGANTTGTVIWTVASACTKADGSVTDDPTFNSESAFATQTMAAANRAWSQTGQFTAITSGNSCVPGGGIIMRLTLSGTASSAINAYQAVVTVPRTTVVQAN